MSSWNVPQIPDITYDENYCKASGKERVSDINRVGQKGCTNVQVTTPLRIHVKALQTVAMSNGGGHGWDIKTRNG